MATSYTTSFTAHNAPRHQLVSLAKAYNKDDAYQLVCALNYTGFSWLVMETILGVTRDITREFEDRMSMDTNLPVRSIASTNPMR